MPKPMNQPRRGRLSTIALIVSVTVEACGPAQDRVPGAGAAAARPEVLVGFRAWYAFGLGLGLRSLPGTCVRGLVFSSSSRP